MRPMSPPPPPEVFACRKPGRGLHGRRGFECESCFEANLKVSPITLLIATRGQNPADPLPLPSSDELRPTIGVKTDSFFSPNNARRFLLWLLAAVFILRMTATARSQWHAHRDNFDFLLASGAVQDGWYKPRTAASVGQIPGRSVAMAHRPPTAGAKPAYWTGPMPGPTFLTSDTSCTPLNVRLYSRTPYRCPTLV